MPNLQRFTSAQDSPHSGFDAALAEISAGGKRSHWIWYIFPQLTGLGRSGMAARYGIGGADEARAYWQHPVLGSRLKECAELVLAVEGRSAHEIFGSPDDLKFRSSMTLFGRAAPDEPVFERALRKYFDGEPDERTLALLQPRS